jgi:hypothetical protein
MRYFVQVVDESNGEIVASLKTDEYEQVQVVAEMAHDRGFTVREPWADITTVSRHEAGWASREAPSTIRKLADMGRAHKEGSSNISIN